MTRQELDFTGVLQAFEALWTVARRIDLSLAAHAMSIPIDVSSWGALHEQLNELQPLYQLVRAELHEAQEIPEVTKEDLEHSLTRAERHRMLRGEFQPGDIEKLRKWCRLTPEEMARALVLPDSAFLQRVDTMAVVLQLSAFGQLLRIAARNPGAFRALVPKEPKT